MKDPLTLNYALLDDAEYTILNLLDGRTQFSHLLTVLQQRFPDRGVGPDDLADFIRALAGHQLIRQTGVGDSQRLDPSVKSNSPIRILQPLFQILRLQLPLFNPAGLISSALPYVAGVFRPAFIKVLGVIALIAVTMVVLRFSDLQRALPGLQEFLGPQNIATMILIFVAVKVLHEAGHAFTARYFGAECNECGIMLLVMTPVLYTNVSDAWMLPRRQRMLVTASGILVELSIAAICTILWWNCAAGVTRSLLLNTMLLCSLNTVFFNGNPLLRFDGYFLLTDWLGIPNLSSRATAVFQAWLLQVFTGQRQPLLAFEERRRTLLLYGMLASCYRLLLTVAILKLVQRVSSQWHVEFLGAILSMSLILGGLFLPSMRFALSVLAAVSSNEAKHTNVGWRSLVSTSVLAIFLLWPLPQSIVAPAFVQPLSSPVYSQLSGRIRPQAEYGQILRRGDVIAVLDSISLRKNLQRLSGRTEELQLQLDAMLRNPATANSELIPTLQKALNAATDRQHEFENEFQNLTIISNHDGVFLPPPETPEQTGTDLPKLWSGAAADSANQGAWIERGVLLGYIGDRSRLQIVACVGENDIEYVRKGQTAEFSSRTGGRTVEVHVNDVGQLHAETIPMPLAVAGLMSGQPGDTGVVPSATTYFVTADPDSTAGSVPPLYSVGRIRINTEPVSIITRLIRYLRQTF